MDMNNSEQLLEEIQTLHATGGVDMNELLNVSDELRRVFLWMIRQNGFQSEDMGSYLGVDADKVHDLLEVLVAKGLVEEISTTQRFYANLGTMRSNRKYRVSSDLWKALE
jgi:hypothetical protein